MIDIQKEAIIENSKIIQPGILKNKIEYYLRKIESTIADNDYGILNDFGEPFQITANQIFKMRVEELVAN
jgi:hypothetical protein